MRRMTIALLAGALLLGALPAAAKMYSSPKSFDEEVAELDRVDRREMSRLDNQALLTAARSREARRLGVPLKIAENRAVDFGLDNSGSWETLADGSRLWRLRLASPGAVHMNLGFSRFDLPPDAALWIYNPALDDVEGPYTARHRTTQGELWTPIVYGDEIVVEVWVPRGAEKAELDVQVGYVNHGFRAFNKFHGDCNIDTVCPDADPYRAQTQSVAFYTLFGQGVCSGQMVNNTAEDLRPLFLSAFHCGVTPATAGSVVVYWNVEAPVCGQQGGGSLDQNQSGTTYLAGDARSDVLLLELNQDPDADFDVFFSGWDSTNVQPQGAVGIHYPQLHVKSISFNEDPLGTVEIDPDTGFIVEGDSHWEVDNWEHGTTEPGSSGSGIWDPVSKLVVGVLTGGFASCFAIEEDFYGKLWAGWEGGGTPDTRLRDHFDPLATGARTLAGRFPSGCRPGEDVLCLQRRRFALQASHQEGGGKAEMKSARVARASNVDSGVFYFFGADNWEVVTKVLDGCHINGYWWVFAGGATSLDWTLTVTDTSTETETSPGTVKKYRSSEATESRVVDVMAFPCDE